MYACMYAWPALAVSPQVNGRAGIIGAGIGIRYSSSMGIYSVTVRVTVTVRIRGAGAEQAVNISRHELISTIITSHCPAKIRLNLLKLFITLLDLPRHILRSAPGCQPQFFGPFNVPVRLCIDLINLILCLCVHSPAQLQLGAGLPQLFMRRVQALGLHHQPGYQGTDECGNANCGPCQHGCRGPAEDLDQPAHCPCTFIKSCHCSMRWMYVQVSSACPPVIPGSHAPISGQLMQLHIAARQACCALMMLPLPALYPASPSRRRSRYGRGSVQMRICLLR